MGAFDVVRCMKDPKQDNARPRRIYADLGHIYECIKDVIKKCQVKD